MLNSRPDPVVSTEMPVPANSSLARAIGLLDSCSSTRSELIDCELDRDLRARVVARHHALELVPPLAAEREDEQLLRDGGGIGRDDVRLRPAVVQLAMHPLHVVGDRRDLADVRQHAAARSASRSIRASSVGRLQRVRRSLEHHLEAVDAGQLLVDDGRGLAERMVRG